LRRSRSGFCRFFGDLVRGLPSLECCRVPVLLQTSAFGLSPSLWQAFDRTATTISTTKAAGFARIHVLNLPPTLGLNSVAISLFARVDRVGQDFLLTINGIAAFLDCFTGRFVDVWGLLPQVVRAFVGLAHQHMAGFLARLRREKETDTYANAQSEEKVY
jgi:hypothetical protein